MSHELSHRSSSRAVSTRKAAASAACNRWLIETSCSAAWTSYLRGGEAFYLLLDAKHQLFRFWLEAGYCALHAKLW